MFKWFSNLFQKRSIRLDDLIPTVNSSAGVRVTEETSLGVPALFRGVDLISSKVAAIPCLVFQRKPDGSKERASNHQSYHLLKNRPNELYSAYTWKKTTIWQALIHGNSYSWIVRDGSGRPIELFLLDPGATLLKDNLTYETSVDGKKKVMQFADVFHLKGIGDGLTGFSVIDLLRDAIGESIALQRYSNAFFRNAARPHLAVELPASLRDEVDIERFRSTLEGKHRGVDNQFRTLLLENGAKLQSYSISNEQAEFLGNREFSLITIANILGLPPHLIGSQINASYSSIEAQDLNFLTYTLDSWLSAFESEANAKLLTEAEKQSDIVFVEFVREAAIQMDTKSKIDVLTTELNNGGISLNEYRAIMNRSNVGAEGDRYRMPSNIAFIDRPDALADTAINRLRKWTEAKVKRSDFQEQLNGFVDYHSAAIVKLLGEAALPILEELREELGAIDRAQITEELWGRYKERFNGNQK